MVIMNFFFEKVDFLKLCRRQNSMQNFPAACWEILHAVLSSAEFTLLTVALRIAVSISIVVNPTRASIDSRVRPNVSWKM